MIPTEPGSYVFHDLIGAPPQKLPVRESDGELVAVFVGDDGEAVEIPVADMAGEFEGPVPQ